MLALSTEGFRGLTLEIRVVMTIVFLKLLNGHPKPTCGLPHVGASLHQPGCRGVAQGVTDDVFVEASVKQNAFPCGAYLSCQRLAVICAMDNEPDWLGHYRGPPYLDPLITGYDTPAGEGYKGEWTRRYDDIQSALHNHDPPAPFSGPDTGSNYPVSKGKGADTSVHGVPFTLRFAEDQSTRISLATQHYYGGSNTVAPIWTPGSYVEGDVVLDTDNFTYRCIQDDADSREHPSALPSFWSGYPAFWRQHGTYAVGEDVPVCNEAVGRAGQVASEG